MSLALALKGKEYIGKMELLDFGIFDFSKPWDENECAVFINEKITEISENTRFDVVCISVMLSLSHDFFKMVAKIVKSIIKDSVIICGGAHPTGSAQYIFRTIKHIDYIVRGEGEVALPSLLYEIYSGSDINTAGVLNRNILEYTSALPRAETPQSINMDFSRYHEVFDMQLYTEKTNLFSLSTANHNVKSFPVMGSRGCPVSCSFCAAKTVHGTKPRWRTIENIRGEILWLNQNYGVTRIYLMDDNFLPRAKAVELFKMLKDLPIEDLDIVIQNLSVNHIDFEIIDLLLDAKVKYIPLAIETGSKEMQKKINKNVDLEKAEKLVKYAKQNGLNVRCFYIIGFPGETLPQINETIGCAERIGANWSSFNVAVPFPGTKMYEEFIRLGYIQDSAEFWKASSIRDRVFDTNEFTAEEIKKIAYEANLKVNFVNSPYIIDKQYSEGKIVFENFIASMNFHIFAYDCLRRINTALGDLSEAQRNVEIMKELLRNDSRAADFEQYFHLLDEDIVKIITSA